MKRILLLMSLGVYNQLAYSAPTTTQSYKPMPQIIQPKVTQSQLPLSSQPNRQVPLAAQPNMQSVQPQNQLFTIGVLKKLTDDKCDATDKKSDKCTKK